MSKLTVARYERMKCGMNSAAKIARTAGVDCFRYLAFDRGGKYRHLNADELDRVATALSVPVSAIADSEGSPLFVD